MNVVLKKLELHGFKSFPDKTVVQLHPGITAIIGPNGCGKSNIVDAVLWVLGEQRIKNLRGENTEDLIFNGSSGKKPLAMTEVAATFTSENGDTAIARRFFRNGEGKYILNDKFCRGKDIQDTLFEMGIGEKTYFIFEQGSVEKMVSLKPSERRVLIEEAAGIVQYLERKRDTAGKLVSAQQNLDSLDAIMADKNNRLRELKNQVQYAQRFRKLKGDRGEALKALLRKKHDRLQEAFARAANGVERGGEAEAALAGEIAILEKAVLADEQVRWETERRLKNAQQEVFEANSRILSAQKEREKSAQRLEFIAQRQKQLAAQLASGAGEVTTLRGEEERQQTERRELETELAERRQAAEAQRRELASAEAGWNDLRRRDEELKKRAFSLAGELAQQRNLRTQAERDLLRIEQQTVHKKTLLADLDKQRQEAGVEGLVAELEAARERQQTLEDARDETRRQVEAARSGAEEITRKVRALKSEIDNLARQRQKYQEIRRKLEGGGEKAPEVKSEGRLVDWVEADPARFRLLEMFYRDEMDAPLAADAGSLQHLPGERLMTKGTGRGTVPAAALGEPGFTARIHDSFALRHEEWRGSYRDGAIAADLPSALRIAAAHGIDVITEAGELVLATGVVCRGRERGLLEVSHEIHAIEKTSLETEEKLATLEERAAAEAEALRPLQGSLEEAVRQAGAAREAGIALASRLETQRRNAERVVARAAAVTAELAALVREDADVRGRLSRMGERLATLEQGESDLNREREALAGETAAATAARGERERQKIETDNALALLAERIAGRTQAARDLRGRIDRLEKAAAAAKVETEQLTREEGATRSRMDSLGDDSRRATEQKKTLEEEIWGLEQSSNQLAAGLKEKQAHLTTRRQQLDGVRQEKGRGEVDLTVVKKDLHQLQEVSLQELGLELAAIEPGETEFAGQAEEDLERVAAEMGERLEKMRESDKLSFSAEKEYELLEKDFHFQETQRSDILRSIADMNEAIDRIDRESRQSFSEAFEKVRTSFKRNFEILFEGGSAELVLSGGENVLEAGLEIEAQPPGKKLQSMRLLSGGEKTLTSLAFLFAMFEYKPSPFCVFDEVDASLDEANIQRFLRFLHQLKSRTQFIIITHNFKTMEEADFIYGISMDEPGISRIYSIRMTPAERGGKE